MKIELENTLNKNNKSGFKGFYLLPLIVVVRWNNKNYLYCGFLNFIVCIYFNKKVGK